MELAARNVGLEARRCVSLSPFPPCRDLISFFCWTQRALWSTLGSAFCAFSACASTARAAFHWRPHATKRIINLRGTFARGTTARSANRASTKPCCASISRTQVCATFARTCTLLFHRLSSSNPMCRCSQLNLLFNKLSKHSKRRSSEQRLQAPLVLQLDQHRQLDRSERESRQWRTMTTKLRFCAQPRSIPRRKLSNRSLTGWTLLLDSTRAAIGTGASHACSQSC